MRNASHTEAPATLPYSSGEMRAAPGCLFCGTPLGVTFVDLGMSPLCESYVSREQLGRMEPFYPLHAYICEKCLLVQLEVFVSPEEIFSDYAYFSSYAVSWVEHMRVYAGMITRRLRLDSRSLVVEVGSNDGYMLQHFVALGIPVLGIEPAANIADVATGKGIPTLTKFFGVQTARELVAEGKQADLIAGANVLAQAPDVNDFVRGLRLLLKPNGIVTMEFPHLMRLIQGNQFDTIYHEHFSYFSFLTAEMIFATHGLTVFDVEELPTHGGSLRAYARRTENRLPVVSPRVEELRNREAAAGLTDLVFYSSFAGRVKETKRQILDFLIDAQRRGKSIAGYGAPGKGNTLLNYCGVRTDFIDYTVDRNPYKQGKYLPGTHIPIYNTDRIRETKPDYVMILPWNLKDEIMAQNSYISAWGGKFVVPIPELEIFS
jgi:2-polyprenyl-3-methyl-5-hydroxy-6-metoxy-1,4-benzoquinol methylase